MTMNCTAIVKEVKKETSAKMFKDLKVGDIIIFSTKIKAVGGNRGTYAVNILIYNESTGAYTYKTFNEIGRLLDCFEWEEVFY